jgi:carbamoyltransferase
LVKRQTISKKNALMTLKRHDKNFEDSKKIFFSDHHLSHAASAFFPSPFEEAIILTADAVGEWATTTVAIGNKNLK